MRLLADNNEEFDQCIETDGIPRMYLYSYREG